MKLILLLITTLGLSTATTLPTVPVLSPDSTSIDPLSPGIGRIVYSTPGTVWGVWFNDNYQNDAPGHNGDFDYNDAVAVVTFGAALHSHLVPVTVQYLASNSAHDNDLHVSAGGNWLEPGEIESFFFPSDHEYTVMMRDENTNWTFRSGPGHLNPDHLEHAWVGTESPATPSQVPEPTSVILIGAGLVGMALLAGLRNGKEN